MSILGYKLEFLGRSETGALILNKNWSGHPLDAPEKWPQGLCTALSMCQHAPVPQLIFWGEEFVRR